LIFTHLLKPLFEGASPPVHAPDPPAKLKERQIL